MIVLGRFWTRVDRSAGHGPHGTCWLWTGNTRGGYGIFGSTDRSGKRWCKSAHRTAYETLVEPIPLGLHIDHVCRNTRCVNPLHMEPVTPAENARRGARYRVREVCRRGHDLATNSYMRKGGRRQCAVCARASLAARRAKARA